ncbi:DUF688 domain-containing protein [Cephalotus follicularis]|uniref:DUF688 domain-containing protein n=1 Tax=Cephalotus follicularis TaxID=3775 RepID=A0A1Q3CU66_CEPFO|nr:DUF688 domain-containing protein [Cephalotus follicularis]
MESLASLSSHAQIVTTKECDTTFPAKKHRSSSRNLSFSSSSSASYFLDDSPDLSPATTPGFSGVPFSWEQLPGIPKKSVHQKNIESTLKHLPLPPNPNPNPQTTTTTSNIFNEDEIGTGKKYTCSESFLKDPFFAALVECSKDVEEEEEAIASRDFLKLPKVSRSISDRFGFVNFYTSCKTTCTVSESIIRLPRSTATFYDRRPR